MKACTPILPIPAAVVPVGTAQKIRAYEGAAVAARRAHRRLVGLLAALVLVCVVCCGYGEVYGWTLALVAGAFGGATVGAVVFHLAEFARLDARRAVRLVELVRRDAGASFSAVGAPWGRAA